MTTLAQMAAVPIVRQFGGRQIRLSPLRLKDFAALNLHLTSLPLEAIKQRIAHMPAEGARFLLRECYQQLERTVMLGAEGFDKDLFLRGVDTVEGILFCLWRAALVWQPDLPLVEAESWVDFTNFQEMRLLVDQLAGFADVPEKKQEPQADRPPADLGGVVPGHGGGVRVGEPPGGVGPDLAAAPGAPPQ